MFGFRFALVLTLLGSLSSAWAQEDRIPALVDRAISGDAAAEAEAIQIYSKERHYQDRIRSQVEGVLEQRLKSATSVTEVRGVFAFQIRTRETLSWGLGSSVASAAIELVPEGKSFLADAILEVIRSGPADRALYQEAGVDVGSLEFKLKEYARYLIEPRNGEPGLALLRGIVATGQAKRVLFSALFPDSRSWKDADPKKIIEHEYYTRYRKAFGKLPWEIVAEAYAEIFGRDDLGSQNSQTVVLRAIADNLREAGQEKELSVLMETLLSRKEFKPGAYKDPAAIEKRFLRMVELVQGIGGHEADLALLDIAVRTDKPYEVQEKIDTWLKARQRNLDETKGEALFSVSEVGKRIDAVVTARAKLQDGQGNEARDLRTAESWLYSVVLNHSAGDISLPLAKEIFKSEGSEADELSRSLNRVRKIDHPALAEFLLQRTQTVLVEGRQGWPDASWIRALAQIGGREAWEAIRTWVESEKGAGQTFHQEAFEALLDRPDLAENRETVSSLISEGRVDESAVREIFDRAELNRAGTEMVRDFSRELIAGPLLKSLPEGKARSACLAGLGNLLNESGAATIKSAALRRDAGAIALAWRDGTPVIINFDFRPDSERKPAVLDEAAEAEAARKLAIDENSQKVRSAIESVMSGQSKAEVRLEQVLRESRRSLDFAKAAAELMKGAIYEVTDAKQRAVLISVLGQTLIADGTLSELERNDGLEGRRFEEAVVRYLGSEATGASEQSVQAAIGALQKASVKGLVSDELSDRIEVNSETRFGAQSKVAELARALDDAASRAPYKRSSERQAFKSDRRPFPHGDDPSAKRRADIPKGEATKVGRNPAEEASGKKPGKAKDEKPGRRSGRR